LPPFRLRKDLDDHHNDDTGPQCPTQRIEQVGHQFKRRGRHRRPERVATDMRGQAHQEGDPQAPVQDPLLVNGPPHLRQVLAYPGEEGAMFPLPETEHVLSLRALLVGEGVWSVLRSRSYGHGRTAAWVPVIPSGSCDSTFCSFAVWVTVN
jgi:hypothetical protein